MSASGKSNKNLVLGALAVVCILAAGYFVWRGLSGGDASVPPTKVQAAEQQLQKIDAGMSDDAKKANQAPAEIDRSSRKGAIKTK